MRYFSSVPLLICFVMKQNMNKDRNILLSLPVQVTSLTFKNNLRIVLGSKREKFKNNEARQKYRYSSKKLCTPSDTNVVFILYCRVAIMLWKDLVADQEGFQIELLTCHGIYSTCRMVCFESW